MNDTRPRRGTPRTRAPARVTHKSEEPGRAAVRIPRGLAAVIGLSAAAWLAGAIEAAPAGAVLLACEQLEATFEVLPKSGYNTFAHRVSRDGKMVVGFSEIGSGLVGSPLLWDEFGALQVLERPAGFTSSDYFHAFEVSDPDPALGTRIVSGIARYTTAQTTVVTYVRWVDGVFEDTGIPSNAANAGPVAVYPFGEAHIDATPDGRILVGTDWTTKQAFTMDFAGPLFANLPGLAPGDGVASAISDDGTVVAGSTYVEGPNCPGSACVPVPAVWTNGALGLLDGGSCGAPYGPTGLVNDLSADGSVAVGRVASCTGTYPTTASAIWRGTELIELPMDLPAEHFQSLPSAISISPDGRYVVGTQNILFGPAYVWTDAQGLRDLSAVLAGDYGLVNEMATWTLAAATGVTVDPDGAVVIVGSMWPTARGNPGDFTAFRVTLEPEDCPDDDRDGLCNDWEDQGYIDVDCNGQRDIPGTDLELPGADSQHMNIYIEADALQTLAPIATSAVTDIEVAFAKVPNALIGNPDGRPGIDLLIDVDDTDIPDFGSTWTRPGGCAMPTQFTTIKASWFGTSLERSYPALLEVKRRLFRYAVLGGVFDNEVQGVAAPFGPDFIVAASGPYEGIREAWAGFGMHEIGHTLGLDHGGPGDPTHYKPNYHSVMNYTWAAPVNVTIDDPLGIKRFQASWILDFSRTAFAHDLDEWTGLDEAAGIGGSEGHGAHFVPVGPLEGSPLSVFARARMEPERGPVDFDRDGVPNEPLSDPTNVNQVNPFDADDFGTTPVLQILRSTADWPYIAQNYRRFFDHPNWRGQSSCIGMALGFHDEKTLSELEGLSLDMPMDCNGNGIEDTDELNAGTASDDDGNSLLDECQPMAGDCDGDDDVDDDDRAIFVSAFGRSEGEPEYLECADLDHDRTVTFVDYQAWVAAQEAAQAAATTSCGALGGGEAAMLLGVWVWQRRRSARAGRSLAEGGGS